jgi:hypothetical protein
MQMRQCIEYLHLLLLFPMQCGKKHSIPSTSSHCSKPGMPSKKHLLQLQAYKHSTSMIISTPPLMLLHPHNAPSTPIPHGCKGCSHRPFGQLQHLLQERRLLQPLCKGLQCRSQPSDASCGVNNALQILDIALRHCLTPRTVGKPTWCRQASKQQL